MLNDIRFSLKSFVTLFDQTRLKSDFSVIYRLPGNHAI